MERDRPLARLFGVCIDCRDAERLGAFYADLLDWKITARDGAGWLQLHDPRGGIGLNIQSEEDYEPPTWPEEPGRQQKMIHLEIEVTDLPAAIERIVASGGCEAEFQPSDRDPSRLRIMLDPAGHPFCVFVAGE